MVYTVGVARATPHINRHSRDESIKTNVLVSVEAVSVSVLETLAIISAVELAIAEPPAVIFGSVSISAEIGIIGIPVSCYVITAFFTSFIKSGVQRSLAQIVSTSPVRISVPITAIALRV